MQGKYGIMLAVGLIALVGIGVALIMSMGAPQQNPSAATVPGGAPPPLTNPNVESAPPETGVAGDTTGNSTTNQSGAATSGSSGGGLYGP
jgi:hypothetical protein